MKKDGIKLAAAASGALIGGIGIKLMRKADGTMNPIASVIALGGGVYLALKGPSDTMKAAGLGLVSIGVIGTVSKIAEKIPAFQKFAPGINGLGELVEIDGEVYQINGLGELVPVEDDEFYNDVEDLEGLNGDEYYDDVEDYELSGLDGDDDMYIAA